MSRICTVCSHPERAAIDRALVHGEPNRRIAARFGLKETSLRRHHAQHLPATLVQAEEARRVADADDLLREASGLYARSLTLLDAAERGQELRVALGGVREARGCLELLARLLGELREGANVAVVVSPAWVEVRAALLEALTPFPDARVAAANRLAALAEEGVSDDDAA